jgi:hypothetical protein
MRGILGARVAGCSRSRKKEGIAWQVEESEEDDTPPKNPLLVNPKQMKSKQRRDRLVNMVLTRFASVDSYIMWRTGRDIKNVEKVRFGMNSLGTATLSSQQIKPTCSSACKKLQRKLWESGGSSTWEISVPSRAGALEGDAEE